MKKIGLWLIILAAFGFIVFDFISSSQKEQQLMEEAQQAVPIDSGDISEDIPVPEAVVEFGVSAGDTAYDFYLEDMDGNYVSLSDYRGKKVFLNFWASWCPPCRVEMPHLQAFAEENDDVVVLGVNVTSSESDVGNVKTFIDEFGLTFPNVYGTDEITYMYYVESLPTSYFIGSDGVIAEAVVGPVTKDILEARFALID